jgi:tRNA threonylcarbamoyladenosine biosynthesis protein TsaB
MELSIDTSTNFAGIGLSEKGEIVAEMTWRSQKNHTVELVPSITQLLNLAKTDKKALQAIFVAKGPGSFNGLRVGVSTAKGLSYALNIPIVGISTLEIEAFPFAYTRLPVCPVHNAGRGEIAVATYQMGNEWRCLKQEHITTIEEMCEGLKKKTIFCGEIPPLILQQLPLIAGENAIIPTSAARMRHVTCLAALAWQQLLKGNKDDAASLQPITMRKVR